MGDGAYVDDTHTSRGFPLRSVRENRKKELGEIEVACGCMYEVRAMSVYETNTYLIHSSQIYNQILEQSPVHSVRASRSCQCDEFQNVLRSKSIWDLLIVIQSMKLGLPIHEFVDSRLDRAEVR